MKTIKKITQAALVAGSMLASSAFAQVAGHNVILVHGFQMDDLSSKPSDEEVIHRQLIPEYWQQRAEARLGWNSAERVEGKISELIFQQAKQLSIQGTCSDGCVIVTHSTGDLVMRYFLAHQEMWLQDAGLQPLDIVAVLDFAGAGGGTELASLAVNVASNGSVPDWIKQAVAGVFGLSLSSDDISDLGVLQDLDVSAARNLAMMPNDIPRLRFSGSGGNFLIHQLIPGADDAVVPAHSSCGASSPEGIDSCSNQVSYSGKLTSVNGPDGLLFNHFPVLMSKNADHGQVIRDEATGAVTYVNNNFSAGLDVDFETEGKRVPWWQVWRETGRFQFIKGSDAKSVSALVYDNLNE
ncbi:hypothetical protein [Litoribacillus peritrichatus]|uniref:Uncharacterized protein n=1 Tax=Litoribacillus peritrichatus TaxID=718191 RepID=A0ABP7MUZ3_9GAMM